MLVEYDEQRLFLDLEDTVDEVLIGEMLDGVTELFEKECGRERAPFRKEQTGRIELQLMRPGAYALYLDYPIKAVTSIELGRNPAAPDETLDPAVAVTIDGRILLRTDGGLWEAGSPLLSFSRGGPWPPASIGVSPGPSRVPGYVRVIYDTGADQPRDAKLAVMRATAMMYDQRGSEGAKSEGRGDWLRTLSRLSEEDWWQRAVAANRRHYL